MFDCLSLGMLAQAAANSPPAPTAAPGHDTFYYASPFIGPTLTLFIGGWWLQRLFVRRANASSFADSMLKRMDEMLADALEYWNLDSQDVQQSKRATVLAQKIKGGTKTLNSDLRYFQGKYASGIDIDPLMENISDACTGGLFESKDRKADEARYLLIVNSFNALKSELLRVKL